MIYSLVGELPRHQYVFVDSNYTHKKYEGFIPAVWFGLVSYPARMWGCTVMFENGAIYRNIPLNALSFSKFENHTFFNSAQNKVQVAIEKIINGYQKEGAGSLIFFVG